MKKILVLTAAFLMTASLAFADMVIAPDALPANVKQFIQANFPTSNIMFAEQDYDSIEVKLNTGVEVEFYINGDWKEIKAYQNSSFTCPSCRCSKKCSSSGFYYKSRKNMEWF